MADAQPADVVVADNPQGEATNDTTKDSSTAPVQNTDSVPQNDVAQIETTPAPNEVAKEADASRTPEEIAFADESNPNQKARDAGAPGEVFDQDGNQRTGGYSYGVAADDTEGTVPEPANKGKKPTDPDFSLAVEERVPASSWMNQDANEGEWTIEDQKKLEDSLSDPSAGIAARVSTSVGKYVTVLFYRNNKPLGSFTSRDFTEAKAKKHLDDLKKTIV